VRPRMLPSRATTRRPQQELKNKSGVFVPVRRSALTTLSVDVCFRQLVTALNMILEDLIFSKSAVGVIKSIDYWPDGKNASSSAKPIALSAKPKLP
jgi:hypothetical protein